MNVQKDLNKQWQQQVLQDDVMDIDEEDIIAITKITSDKKNEAENLVYSLLNNRLGELAPSVLRYLDKEPKIKRNTMSVLNMAQASLRYNVSPTATAAIGTAYLQDLIKAGHLPPNMSYLDIDPIKIVRARKVSMNKSREEDTEKEGEEKITGIYFDGRKDKTRALIPDSFGKVHPRIVKEEHISVTVEPSGKYLTHFTPLPAKYPEKPALKEAESLFGVLQDLESTETCKVIGGDSTQSNTGWKGGTMAHLERLLGHKCQWVVCNIHTLELLLKHFIA